MISVVIYDDHKNRRDGLKLLISLEPDMVCFADFDNCVNIVHDLKDLLPDVVLMDIDMPGMSGIEAVKLIRANYPLTLIIMQTVFDEDDKIFNSIRAGANGYYLKKTEPEKLIEGIREVVEGGAPMTASVARRILNFLNEQPEKKANNTFNLSSREIEVLNFLVKGYSQKMIAAELGISRFTVNNHLAKIYEKLQVHNASEAVASAINKKIITPSN
jgi:DNA-binding NarL/FixJ family response regulator